MMSNADIEQLQREMAARAQHARLEPFVLFDTESAFNDIRYATPLGDYVPPGWKPARYEDYASELLPCCEVSQENCASEFRGELIWWVDKFGFGPERGEYGIEQIREDAPKLVRIAANRGVALGVGICESGQFQAYLRFFEKPYISTHRYVEAQ